MHCVLDVSWCHVASTKESRECARLRPDLDPRAVELYMLAAGVGMRIWRPESEDLSFLSRRVWHRMLAGDWYFHFSPWRIAWNAALKVTRPKGPPHSSPGSLSKAVGVLSRGHCGSERVKTWLLITPTLCYDPGLLGLALNSYAVVHWVFGKSGQHQSTNYWLYLFQSRECAILVNIWTLAFFWNKTSLLPALEGVISTEGSVVPLRAIIPFQSFIMSSNKCQVSQVPLRLDLGYYTGQAVFLRILASGAGLVHSETPEIPSQPWKSFQDMSIWLNWDFIWLCFSWYEHHSVAPCIKD